MSTNLETGKPETPTSPPPAAGIESRAWSTVRPPPGLPIIQPSEDYGLQKYIDFTPNPSQQFEIRRFNFKTPPRLNCIVSTTKGVLRCHSPLEHHATRASQRQAIAVRRCGRRSRTKSSRSVSSVMRRSI